MCQGARSRMLSAFSRTEPTDWHLEADCQTPGKGAWSGCFSVCLGSQDGPLVGRDPQGLGASSKAPPSCWAREARWGWGGRAALVQPTDCSLTQRTLSELLAGRASQTFFFRGLCAEYKSSSLIGLSHKLAPVTKKVLQSEGGPL